MVRFGTTTPLLAAAWAGWAAGVPADKQVIELVPKFGTVTFTHRAHSERLGDDCIVCHHSYQDAGDSIQSCYECHQAVIHRVAAVVPAATEVPGQAQDAPPKAEHAFHALCIECHELARAGGRPTGPTDSCRDCHV